MMPANTKPCCRPDGSHYDFCLMTNGTPEEAAEAFARQYLPSNPEAGDYALLVAHLVPMLKRRDLAAYRSLVARAAEALVARALRIEELSRPLRKHQHDMALVRLEYWKEAAKALTDEEHPLVPEKETP